MSHRATTIWRVFETLSLLVWGAMIAVYVIGLTMVPVMPHMERSGPLPPGHCYNLLSKIGTPLFHCSETGFDSPAETLLTAAWLWVHPFLLLPLAVLEGMFWPTAASWILLTIGVFAFFKRCIVDRINRR